MLAKLRDALYKLAQPTIIWICETICEWGEGDALHHGYQVLLFWFANVGEQKKHFNHDCKK